MSDTSANQQTAPIFVTEEEFDLRVIFQTLWKKRSTIALTSLVTLSVAAIYAFYIATPIFESSALLLPTQATTPDALGSAAALLGKKPSTSGDLDLYQSLLNSRTVIHKLLMTTVSNRSDTAKGAMEPLFRVLQIDTSLPLEMEMATYKLSNEISVGSKASGEGGILEVRISSTQPWLAQEIGNSVLAIGQEELRQIRIERAEVILPRLALVVSQAQAEWDSAARNLTSYQDRNRSISLPEQLLTVSRLEIEKEAEEQKYLLVRKEYEMQLLERSKATPPMMILDPANLPAKKSKPQRSAILVAGLMLGIIGSSFSILGWNTFVARKLGK
jgi:uncharacterized protein involved in exopolysaccharide biosynthesis